MRQRTLFPSTKRRAVMLQLWSEHSEPFKAFVVLAKTGMHPVDLARFVVVELGADIGSTGLAAEKFRGRLENDIGSSIHPVLRWLVTDEGFTPVNE